MGCDVPFCMRKMSSCNIRGGGVTSYLWAKHHHHMEARGGVGCGEYWRRGPTGRLVTEPHPVPPPQPKCRKVWVTTHAQSTDCKNLSKRVDDDTKHNIQNYDDDDEIKREIEQAPQAVAALRKQISKSPAGPNAAQQSEGEALQQTSTDSLNIICTAQAAGWNYFASTFWGLWVCHALGVPSFGCATFWGHAPSARRERGAGSNSKPLCRKLVASTNHRRPTSGRYRSLLQAAHACNLRGRTPPLSMQQYLCGRCSKKAGWLPCSTLGVRRYGLCIDEAFAALA